MSNPVFSTPREAEQAFYDAFERANLEAMMSVWAPDDGIICIHPMGPRLVGRRAVARSWREIFEGAVPMRFELTEVERTGDERVAVHCVYENIDHGMRLVEHSVVLATNVYRFTEQGWRMIVHHASPGGHAETEKRGSEVVH